MSVPNHFAIVQQVFAVGGWTLTTKQGCGEFTEAVVLALHAVDPNWGHFRKRPGQEQWNGHAVDAACYKLGSGVDFIASSQSPTARINWLPYPDAPPSADWYFTDAPVVNPDSPVVNLPPDAVLADIVRRLERIEAKQALSYTLTLAPTPKS